MKHLLGTIGHANMRFRIGSPSCSSFIMTLQAKFPDYPLIAFCGFSAFCQGTAIMVTTQPKLRLLDGVPAGCFAHSQAIPLAPSPTHSAGLEPRIGAGDGRCYRLRRRLQFGFLGRPSSNAEKADQQF